MAELNGLPVYNIKISEDLGNNTGIDFISLVDYPAIESNWIAMGDHKKPMKFVASEDKQLLYGPILIPGLPIYRFDKELGEYYVVFSAEEIQKIVRKFQASQKTINLNYQHQKDSQLKQAVVQEIWLTGAKDKSQDLGFDLPANTAFVCTHIGDTEFWDNEIKTGNVKGFSIEGFLDMELKKLIKQKMEKQNFTAYKQADGGDDVFIDGEIAVDNYVFSNWPSVTLVNGVKQVTQYPVWQQTVVLDDGTILNLKDSKILSIEKKQGMSKKKLAAEAKTNDGLTMKTSADTLAVGSDVVIVAADGTETVPADGDYTLESGDVVSVSGGKITAINTMDLSQEEENALTEIIQAAVLNAIKPLSDKVTALEQKLSNAPGAASATENTDLPTTTTKLSIKKSLLSKLEILRKKDNEMVKEAKK